MPRIDPAPARTRLSVRSCRRIRPRPAPSAVRIAISLCRPVARARRRLATFAQAIRRTNATAPRRTVSAGREEPVICSASGAAPAVHPECRGVLRRDLSRDGAQVPVRGFDGHSGAQAPDHGQVVGPALRLHVRPEPQRDPRCRAAGGKLEPGRHDADDPVVDAVEADRAADGRRVAPERLAPQRVPEDGRARALAHELLGGERPGERRRDRERREELPGADRHGDPFGRRARPRPGELFLVVHAEGLEGAVARAPVDVVRRRHRELREAALRVRLEYIHEPVGLRIGQRPEEHALDHREDRRVRPDPEGERCDRHGGEAG